MRAKRFATNPIIRPDMDDRMGHNINGPSLIRVPDWVDEPLGRYYLYFAHHQGTYIRMAYADELAGPWTVYTPGVLDLDETPFVRHIASPDVHVDHGQRRIRMYCHGPVPEAGQRTRVALSTDGLHFDCRDEILGSAYFRVFAWKGATYASAVAGRYYRSPDPEGLTGFEPSPNPWPRVIRHTATLVHDRTLYLFHSRYWACPEHIVVSTVDDLGRDWTTWTLSEPVTVLKPEHAYEGADLPLEPSEGGWAPERVRQLRDPAIYREGDRLYLLYSVAGESGIAIAELAGLDG
jgi:hypothetical protein